MSERDGLYPSFPQGHRPPSSRRAHDAVTVDPSERDSDPEPRPRRGARPGIASPPAAIPGRVVGRRSTEPSSSPHRSNVLASRTCDRISHTCTCWSPPFPGIHEQTSYRGFSGQHHAAAGIRQFDGLEGRNFHSRDAFTWPPNECPCCERRERCPSDRSTASRRVGGRWRMYDVNRSVARLDGV
jgi:hypothetical protein